jgi:excisionase family DNA binding protein
MKNQASPYTVDEARAAIGDKVSRNGFYEAIARGEIPSVRVGRRILIPRAPFNAMFGIADQSLAA